MKNKFLLSAMFLLLLVGLYSPASYSAQAYNMWCANDSFTPGCTSYSFDVYIQNTGDPLSIYSVQFGWTYTTAAKGTGTLTAVWSNVASQFSAGGETPKTTSCAAPYIKAGWNVNSGGSGAGVSIPSSALRIGTLTVTNTVAFVGYPLVTWYFGGSPGLPTKIQATDGASVYDVTLLGTYTYLLPAGGVLPVELSSFASAAQGRTVVLNWSTKTEKNSDRFEVERSIVNGTWSTVGTVKAAVLSNSPKNYSYTDTKLQSGKYQYRLKMVDNNGSFTYSSVEAATVAIPKDFSVSQNYPNPFNPSTKIDYQVPVDAKVVMEVYNIAGQRVFELVNQEQSAGYYTVDFGASKLASGVYIYRIVASDKATGNNFSSIKKMMLLK